MFVQMPRGGLYERNPKAWFALRDQLRAAGRWYGDQQRTQVAEGEPAPQIARTEGAVDVHHPVPTAVTGELDQISLLDLLQDPDWGISTFEYNVDNDTTRYADLYLLLYLPTCPFSVLDQTSFLRTRLGTILRVINLKVPLQATYLDRNPFQLQCATQGLLKIPKAYSPYALRAITCTSGLSAYTIQQTKRILATIPTVRYINSFKGLIQCTTLSNGTLQSAMNLLEKEICNETSVVTKNAWPAWGYTIIQMMGWPTCYG